MNKELTQATATQEQATQPTLQPPKLMRAEEFAVKIKTIEQMVIGTAADLMVKAFLAFINSDKAVTMALNGKSPAMSDVDAEPWEKELKKEEAKWKETYGVSEETLADLYGAAEIRFHETLKDLGWVELEDGSFEPLEGPQFRKFNPAGDLTE